jgi:hypothetical protein
MTHFIVDPDQLKDHAGQTRQIAKGVDQAADAASEEGIGGVDAYGLICSPILIPALHLFFGDAGSLVKSAADFGDAMADGLESNSDVYAGVDKDIHGALTKLHSDLIS